MFLDLGWTKRVTHKYQRDTRNLFPSPEGRSGLDWRRNGNDRRRYEERKRKEIRLRGYVMTEEMTEEIRIIAKIRRKGRPGWETGILMNRLSLLSRNTLLFFRPTRDKGILRDHWSEIQQCLVDTLDQRVDKPLRWKWKMCRVFVLWKRAVRQNSGRDSTEHVNLLGWITLASSQNWVSYQRNG